MAEPVALQRMHAGGPQEQVLLGGLDALGGHLHAEAAAEADHRVHDGGGVGRPFDRAHEARIDLELVEREAAQILQARIAGAEIVERQPHAQRLEPEHRELGRVHVAEQRAFGDLEFEPGRIEAGFGEDPLHDVDEVGAAELQRRDIDGNKDAGPGLGVEAGAAQHQFAERDDQAAVLGDRDELGRRDLAALRMGPAAKRFDAENGFAAVVDDRLIGHPQLVVLDRRPQVVLEQLAPEQVGVHRLVVDAGAVAAFVLGAVERHVGMPHDVGGAADMLVDDGDADAGADHDACGC